MTEQPNALLVLLLSLAAAVAAAVGAALAGVSDCDVGGFATNILASLSACVIFFHRVPSVPFGALVLALLALSSLLALARILRQALREQRLLRRLPLVAADEETFAAPPGAAERGSVFVVPASRPVAFCLGLLRPRIVISTGLLERLGPEEQAAAIWHETAHAYRREPLRSLLARIAAAMLFWLPAVGDILARYLLAKELAADRLALEKTSRHALAGALCGLLDEPPLRGAVGLGDLAAPRVERLLDPAAPLPPLFRPARVLVTLLVVAVLLLLVAVPAQVRIGAIDSIHALLPLLQEAAAAVVNALG